MKEAIALSKLLKSLVGRCAWGMPEDLCTVNELNLRQQYVILSTKYHVLCGLLSG